MGISSWNFVRMPKAMLLAPVKSFRLKFSAWMLFLALFIFARLFWRSRETLVKQYPGPIKSVITYYKPISGDVAWSRESVHVVRERETEVTSNVSREANDLTQITGARERRWFSWGGGGGGGGGGQERDDDIAGWGGGGILITIATSFHYLNPRISF